MAQKTLDDVPADGSTADGLSEISPPERALNDADRCLSITVRGSWGHFRRIEGNVVKQTYRVIPRTTVAGLLAAVLGRGRDEYYDLFAAGESLVAIEPTGEIRTMNMPMNTLSTSPEGMASLNSRGKISIKLPDPTALRQQHNYEVLVDPAYRIDVWLSDETAYEELKTALSDGRSYYTPSLGLSEHLAEIDYHGEFDVEPGPDEDRVAVDSVVPNATDCIVPEPGVRHQIERSQAYMEADSSGRTTTEFVDYAYSPDDDPLTATDLTTSVVDGRTVMFV